MVVERMVVEVVACAEVVAVDVDCAGTGVDVGVTVSDVSVVVVVKGGITRIVDDPAVVDGVCTFVVTEVVK